MLKNSILTRVALIILLVLTLGFNVSCDDYNNSIGPSTETEDLLVSDPSPSFAFDLDTALEMMRLCLYSYQMLIDYDNGEQFTLPSQYNLVIQLLTP